MLRFIFLFLALIVGILVLNKSDSHDKQKGVSWVAGRTVDSLDFQPLINNHVNWIVQMPFGWQAAYDQPEIRLATGNRILWGESDSGLVRTTRLAKAWQIKTLLKPHIWLRGRQSGKWRSDIAMTSESDWNSWFANYRTFIIHYAKLAEAQQIEALCIGTELYETAIQRPLQWRDLIREIRFVYSGKLTYAANWYKEFEEISFWDELDFIGIQAYFPLSTSEKPDLQTLVDGWQQHLKSIEIVQSKFNKPVIFTEIGYKSTANSTIEPWLWPQGQGDLQESQLDENTQKIAYEAFFEVFWDTDWFAGVYFWKWYPHYQYIKNHRYFAIDFTPQHKAAELTIREWYSK
ncbi:MAG: hypothetical protein KDD94_03490 [Calditrichaeota bacterium]|nr:hypothetical protein [Calditrichota bacterium]